MALLGAKEVTDRMNYAGPVLQGKYPNSAQAWNRARWQIAQIRDMQDRLQDQDPEVWAAMVKSMQMHEELAVHFERERRQQQIDAVTALNRSGIEAREKARKKRLKETISEQKRRARQDRKMCWRNFRSPRQLARISL